MTTIQCSVCRLDQPRRNAIDRALRDPRITLDELSATAGVTRSSLHRHSRHLDSNAKSVDLDAASDDEPGLSKLEILNRIEHLWNECMSGLAAAKSPLYLTKKDGSTIELPAGDLKSRSSFVREARHCLEASADWAGYPRQLVSGPGGGGAVVIVLPPHRDWAPGDLDDDGAVTLALPQRRGN